ncbi:MAG: proline dehydrogenase [Armatimonadetes bacterium]|nr:MAG: proline dehydrogenase [Armatimonadota bacterium]MCE7898874.1 proline dehydrogenase [Armatimonadetes bacterium ATM1]MDL1928938.1 proline dehydrogenase [Fimbriimonadia bacterium ATM]MBC6969605.1 proline dehydrogenase [Armatimonadota bacterium]MBL1150898.1 proline dehydrogenase [Armatimonadota bacterium]
MLRNVILSVAKRRLIENFVRNSSLTKRVVRRFIAGNCLDEAMPIVEGLVESGYKTSLDFLGEDTTNPEEADAALAEYLRVVDAIAASPHRGGWQPENINISIKLSQLGLLADFQGCGRRLIRLLEAAEKYRIFVRIDMESSSTVDATLELAEAAFCKHRNVGIVLQAMLHRTATDLDWAIARRIRVRLVKGAYLEPPAVALQKKSEVDAAYLQYAQRLALDGIFPAFATHDATLARAIADYADANAVGPGRFEFQMLYGIARRLQRDLKREGRIVRVYCPYGDSWYPYFTRRLAERPANLAFFLRSLFSR